MTHTGPRLKGAERLQKAQALKEKYEAGASIRDLVEETGHAAETVRSLLTLAGARIRPSGGYSRTPKKRVKPRVVVKRIAFQPAAPAAAPTGPLNKTGLAEAVAADLGISVQDGFRVLDAVLGPIARTVTAGHDVTVTNFGTWRHVHHPARKARNPQTGEKVTVPARSAVRFRVSPRLQDVVNGGDPSASLKKRRSR